MSRKLVERWHISGTLTLLGPLSVGGAEDDWLSDNPVARNGAGCIAIPGTAIAGALRSWFEYAGSTSATGKDEDHNSVWGFADDERPDFGSASYLYFDDAVLKGDRHATSIRDGVGIDRVEGRAADRIKFDREVVAAGRTFSFSMSAEIPPAAEGDRVKNTAMQIIKALESGEVRLGAATTRGLGAVKLTARTISSLALNDKDAFLASMAGAVKLAETPATGDLTRPARVAIKIGWRPVGPVMIKASTSGRQFEILPFMSAKGESIAPTIPGASIKGVMRSTADRIMATVWGTEPAESSSNTRFLAMMGEKADPLVRALFGSVREKQKEGENEKIRAGRAALTFKDTQSKVTISGEMWPKLIEWNDWQKMHTTAMPRGLQQAAIPMTHVAIDRFTAAPADGKLFTALTLHGLRYDPIEIVLAAERLDAVEGRQSAALALLLLVLKEMVDGSVPIGFGSTRGYGAIKIESIEITCINGGGLGDGFRELTSLSLADFVSLETLGGKAPAISGAWKALFAEGGHG